MGSEMCIRDSLEGWALYVEFLSYDYAADLLEQAGQPDAAQVARLEKHTRSLQLCMYTLRMQLDGLLPRRIFHL